MTKLQKVNLPDGLENMTPHPGFPEGSNIDALVKAREVIRWAADKAGFQETGCGFGAREGTDGEADIGLVIDGRAVEVRIYLPKL